MYLQAISALRNAASGSPKGGDDKNIIQGKMSNIVPTDDQSLAFERTPAQVCYHCSEHLDAMKFQLIQYHCPRF